ncbi:uncharacterized protein LOC104883810 [Beta vulgaris subsp. vulgaris]|uniref:uncharacterized protein LOC104883810 n=1 Tax=Beta vulgaris subsp. vulgaris TaxID=3555 RepID=UPI00053FC08E|nr:uncharacterized protein LOC104883810 [Beta vulgaris subsp. vulgaris]
MLSSEEVRAKTLSSEENDLLQRSNKKFKRLECDSPTEGNDVSMVPDTMDTTLNLNKTISYSQAARGFGGSRNPLFEGEVPDSEIISEDEQESDDDSGDLACPTIRLTREEKRRIRVPWKNSLIIKLFDKKLGYDVLMRRLKAKWTLKGEIALIDVGHAYYVVRFSNLEDYDFVLTQGPWMIGESYLTIKKWVPNFIADEAPIKTLTAWVRIPHLSVEYFDKQILHKIGSKIGNVIKIDRNTASMDRGQYVRFCIEVDLSKPLLSKFKLNKRTWIIQYEGLKMICFKCGHLGHKEDNCT